MSIDESRIPLPPTARAARRPPTNKERRIASELEERFLLGQYRFGETLSIAGLAGQFEGSRQPVASALAHLESCGYVEIIPQVGCRIADPSPSEIVDFFRVLARIEGVVAFLASERGAESERDELLETASSAAPSAYLGHAGRKVYIRDLEAFHGQIWRMSRSGLEARLGHLRRLSSFYLWQGTTIDDGAPAQRFVTERLEIASLIHVRESWSAQLAMESHIASKPRLVGLV